MKPLKRFILPLYASFWGTLLFLQACGTLGSDQGGGSNLPNRGIAPYEKMRFEESSFLIENTGDYPVSGPSAHVRNGTVQLYFMGSTTSGEPCVLRRRADPSWVFSEAECVLPLTDAPAWVGGSMASPSLTHDGSEWWMALVVNEGEAIALIPGGEGTSFDWTRASQVWNAPEASTLEAPSLVWDDDRFLLYFGRAGLIERASGRPDSGFTSDGVMLTPDNACDSGDCWDGEWVGEPDVRRAVGGDGITVYRMFYSAGTSGKRDIGFAASYDGLNWTRYGRNPSISDGPEEREPSQVLFDGSYYLFFMEYRAAGNSGIAVAQSAEGSPTDTWSDD